MGGLSSDLWQSVRLTIELAAITTVILLLIGTPIAWSSSAKAARIGG